MLPPTKLEFLLILEWFCDIMDWIYLIHIGVFPLLSHIYKLFQIQLCIHNSKRRLDHIRKPALQWVVYNIYDVVQLFFVLVDMNVPTNGDTLHTQIAYRYVILLVHDTLFHFIEHTAPDSRTIKVCSRNWFGYWPVGYWRWMMYIGNSSIVLEHRSIWYCVTSSARLISHQSRVQRWCYLITFDCIRSSRMMILLLLPTLLLLHVVRGDREGSRDLSSEDFARGADIQPYSLPWWHPEIEWMARNRVRRRNVQFVALRIV